MDFIDKIRTLAAAVPKQLDHLKTEEGTKNCLVMPFIQALGYNVFDPTEVTPELVADVGTKRGEKVDYAILKDGQPIMLFECKAHGVELDKEQASQLFRYFSVTAARFAVLTNGIVYRFYSDLEEPNKMDAKPFLEFNLLDISEPLVEELKKFTKSSFDLDVILATAIDLMYTKEIKRVLAEQLISPAEDLVRFFASQVCPGRRMTAATRQQLTELVKQAFQQFISDRIADRLKSALKQETAEAGGEVKPGAPAEAVQSEPEPSGVVTTQDEIEAYLIVKAILREIVDPKRVVMRDAKSYCAILLDDTNRRPICRLYFNTAQKYLGVIGEQKQEQRVPIADLNDIYGLADQLKGAVALYEPPAPTST